MVKSINNLNSLIIWGKKTHLFEEMVADAFG